MGLSRSSTNNSDVFYPSVVSSFFLLLIIVLPFYKFPLFVIQLPRSVIGSFSIGISDLVFLMLLALIIGKILIKGKLNFPRNLIPISTMILVFLFYSFLTILWAPSSGTFLYYFLRMFQGIIYFFLPLILIKRKIYLEQVVVTFAATSIFFLIDAVARTFIIFRGEATTNLWQFYATFKSSFLVKDTNTVAIYIILASTLVIFLIFKENRKWWKIILAINIVVFVSTLSREAFIASAISCIIVLFYLRRSDPIRKIIVKSLIIFTILGTFLLISSRFFIQDIYISFLVKRFMGIFSILHEAGFVSRISLFKIALKMLLASPIIGVGIGGYRVCASVTGYTFIHNLYLTILVSEGIFGFGLFLIFISMILARLFSLSRKSTLAALGLLGVIAYLIQGFVMFDLTESYFWLYMGIVLVGSKIELKER